MLLILLLISTLLLGVFMGLLIGPFTNLDEKMASIILSKLAFVNDSVAGKIAAAQIQAQTKDNSNE